MFDPEFFPTPVQVIETMLDGETINGKTILEPSAGKGDIVDYLLNQEALAILAVEKNGDLRAILQKKCTVLGNDFLEIQSQQVTHVDLIVMNPPFSQDDRHITHAFVIAPPGCRIIALCNHCRYHNDSLRAKRAFRTLVESHGTIENLGPCFQEAEEATSIDIGLIKMQKPGGGYEHEFEGFFMFEEEETQAEGVLPYNVIRDLVNRYVQAVKIYDKQLAIGVEMGGILSEYFDTSLTFTTNEKVLQGQRNTFKKDLQKSGWNYIFRKLNLEKYSTRALKEDISKFVEKQSQIPFTMRNVYLMLEIVSGTTTQRMDKALLEVFDKITSHHAENQYRREGWKTNSHYLVNRKFILPGMCWQDQRYYKGQNEIQCDYRGYWEFVEDLVKALCFISGDDFETFGSLRSWVTHRYKIVTESEVFFYYRGDGYQGYTDRITALQAAGYAYEFVDHQPIYGQWFDWAYFRVKAFKKGSMHFEFTDEDLWGRFNQRIARLKGYPLFDTKPEDGRQRGQSGRAKRA